MKKYYIIAYKDLDGRGFDEEYPWLHDVGEDIEMLKENTLLLEEVGYLNVTPFYITENEYLERIPWSYVNEHKVEF